MLTKVMKFKLLTERKQRCILKRITYLKGCFLNETET